MTYRNIVLPASILALAGIGLTFGAAPAHACSPDNVYVGAICTFPFNFCPSGFVATDGRTLTIQQNMGLYSLIGIKYGGDGKTTFAVPDLRGRVAVGSGIVQTQQGSMRVLTGQKLGAESTTVPVLSHVHQATFVPTSAPVNIQVGWQASGAAGTDTAPSSNAQYISATPAGQAAAKMWAPNPPSNPVTMSGINPSISGGSGITGGTVTVNPVADSTMSLISPQTAVSYCIATTGLYPPRP